MRHPMHTSSVFSGLGPQTQTTQLCWVCQHSAMHVSRVMNGARVAHARVMYASSSRFTVLGILGI